MLFDFIFVGKRKTDHVANWMLIFKVAREEKETMMTTFKLIPILVVNSIPTELLVAGCDRREGNSQDRAPALPTQNKGN